MSILSRRASWGIALFSLVCGCGSSGTNVVGQPGSGGGSNGGAGNAGTGASQGTGAIGTGAGGSGTGTGATGSGTGGSTSGFGGSGTGSGGVIFNLDGGIGVIPGGETKCDGLDDDGNGIIDDVDVGGDGVCDCLNIATLGYPGGWGTGNVFADWLNARSPIGAVTLQDQDLTTVNLAQFQIIVTESIVEGGSRGAPAVHPYSTAEAAALEAWVRIGGGLMTTTGYVNSSGENVNVNRLLVFAGMNYDVTSGRNAYSVNGLISDWSPHPTTDGLLVPGGTNGTAHIQNGWAPEGSGSVVGRDALGRTALLVNTVDNGRIAMWGDEWITYDKDWLNTSYKIELLWLNLLKWLSPPNQCQVPIPQTVY